MVLFKNAIRHSGQKTLQTAQWHLHHMTIKASWSIFSGPTVGPLVTPMGLKSLVLSPRTVWLEWHDPSLGRAQKITDGRYYIVSYKNLPDGEEKTVTVKV